METETNNKRLQTAFVILVSILQLVGAIPLVAACVKMHWNPQTVLTSLGMFLLSAVPMKK